MITIFIIDDHKILRQGIKILLEEEKDLKVIGEAASGEEGISLVENLMPDVLICELSLDGMNGIEVTREIIIRAPETKTLILSMYNDPGYVHRALKTGAKGYLLKGCGVEELLEAVRQVASGKQYLSPGLEPEKYLK